MRLEISIESIQMSPEISSLICIDLMEISTVIITLEISHQFWGLRLEISIRFLLIGNYHQFYQYFTSILYKTEYDGKNKDIPLKFACVVLFLHGNIFRFEAIPTTENNFLKRKVKNWGKGLNLTNVLFLMLW